jgi:transglutaminase-like putative cysteine protease
MRLKIQHTTQYRYDAPVGYGLLQLRKTPKSRPLQRLLSWAIGIEGGRTEATFEDQHANTVHLVSVDAGVQAVTIRCEGEVEVRDNAGVVGPHTSYAPLWLFRRATRLTQPGPLIRKLVRSVPSAEIGDIPRLHALVTLVRDAVVYETGRTDAGTRAEEALEAGHGVCQDHAHIFLAAARLLGYPARYAGGYLRMAGLVDQDAGHAWAEAHVEGLGWVGFDVSNAISPDDRYVRVATGLDYRDAAPVSGLRFGEAAESMDVTIQVQEQ